MHERQTVSMKRKQKPTNTLRTLMLHSKYLDTFLAQKKHLKKKKTHWLHAKHESSCINKIRINVPWHWIHIGLLKFQRVYRALNGNTNSSMNLVHLGGFYACCAHNKTSSNRKSWSARFFGVNTFCLRYELNR